MKNRPHLTVWKVGLGYVVAFVAAVASTLSADEATLREFLARQVVSPDLMMTEVKRFCDTRVPRMPQVTSVKE